MNSYEFDFAHWSDLAKNDPEAFEAKRIEVINALLDSINSDKKHRLRGMQWRLDKIRETAATPLAACLKMNQMMWESLMGEGGLIDILDGYRQGHNAIPAQVSPQSATILPFKLR